MAKNLSSLRTGIVKWSYQKLGDNSHYRLEEVIDDIIQMAEELIYYGSLADDIPGLRVPELFTAESITVPAGDRTIAIDHAILEIIEVLFLPIPAVRPESYYGTLDTPAAVRRAGEQGLNTSRLYYALQGSQIEFPIGAATDFDVELMCYKRPGYFYDVPVEHDAFRNHYSVWLAAGCFSALKFLGGAQDLDHWRGLTAELIKTASSTQRGRFMELHTVRQVRPVEGVAASG